MSKSVGRRSKLTPEVQARIVDSLRAGNYQEVAYQLSGVHPRNVYRWLEKGEQEDAGIYRDFLNAVRAAQAEAEARNVMIVQKAAAGFEVERQTTKRYVEDGKLVEETTTTKERQFDWRAAAWYLERAHGRRWRQKVSVDVNEQQALAELLGVKPDELPAAPEPQGDADA